MEGDAIKTNVSENEVCTCVNIYSSYEPGNDREEEKRNSLERC